MARRSKSVDDEPVLWIPDEPPEHLRKPLTIYEQVDRNLAVVTERTRGDGWADIANRHGLTIRRCKQIHAEYRTSNPTLRHHDPVEVVDELLEGYAADLKELSNAHDRAVAAGTMSVQVQAINARMGARAKIAELLQAIGVLPHDLGTMHHVIDGRVTAERVITILERYELPDEIFEELEAAFEYDGGPPQLEEATS